MLKNILLRSFIIIVSHLCLMSFLYSQSNKNYLDIKIRNDNADAISTLFHTGDDVGETYDVSASYNNINWSDKYNYRFKVESKEFSNYDTSTLEPRDLLFDELNNFVFTFDNNKLLDNEFYYSLSVGMYLIQSNKISIGATGQKYLIHKYIVDKFYKERYWLYNSSHKPDKYFPYIELTYGYNKSFFKTKDFELHTISDVGIFILNNNNFNGLNAKLDANLRFFKKFLWMSEIDILTEGLDRKSTRLNSSH